jgi:HSP20 family protein
MNRSIIPFPFSDFDRFWADDFFGGAAELSPKMDVYQKEDSVMVELPLPGINPNDVQIVVENDVLTVNGHTEDKKEVKREDYYRKETRSGHFTRSVVLPMPVKNAEAQARYDKGILTIELPKDEQAKPKQIAIEIATEK